MPSTDHVSSMKRPSRLQSLLLTRLLSLSATVTSEAAHYRVDLPDGQSYANGRGDAEPLACAQTDLRFYWHRTQGATNLGHLTEDTWTDLTPDTGDYTVVVSKEP